MGAATDRSSWADSAARGYSDLETVRRRLIELEKNRLFSDEDLAILLRKSVQTNLKADFDYRSFSRKMRRTNSVSGRTTSGRAVIRSWAPLEAEPKERVEEEGWKQFEAVTTTQERNLSLPPVSPRRSIRRPTRLKRMQNRNFIITFFANLIFVPRQACSSLYGMLVPSSRRRAC